MSITRFERKLEKIEKRPSKHEQRFEAIRISYIAHQVECYLFLDGREIDEENSAVIAYRQAEKNPRFRKYIEEINQKKRDYEESAIDKYLTKEGD